MNCLVVGGAGYIGGALLDILAEMPDVKVTVYDSLLFHDDYTKKVDFVCGDIRDRKKLKPYLRQADVVVWLAALVGDGACAINPRLTKEINEDSIAWLSRNYQGRTIFMSTCSVYGASDDVLDETSPTNPLSDYARSKLQAEKWLDDGLIFRLGTLFGLGGEFSRLRFDLVANVMMANALSTGRLYVYGGEQWRPLLHVRDAARAIADNLTTGTGIYNLHTANIRMSELAAIVSGLTNATVQTVNTKVEDQRNYRVNSYKARTELVFNPTISVEAGLQELKAALEAGRVKDPADPKYHNKIYLEEYGVI